MELPEAASIRGSPGKNCSRDPPLLIDLPPLREPLAEFALARHRNLDSVLHYDLPPSLKRSAEVARLRRRTGRRIRRGSPAKERAKLRSRRHVMTRMSVITESLCNKKRSNRALCPRYVHLTLFREDDGKFLPVNLCYRPGKF